jgi:NAD(P)-dependent dehydrogenase (short-subunit alcohol dehydrogenase family)
MRNLWRDEHVGANTSDLAACTYVAHLLGQSPVFAGTGTISAKANAEDVFGESHEILYVSASGCRLAELRQEDFVSLALRRVRRLAQLPQLSAAHLEEELRSCATAPTHLDPSPAALWHAQLSQKFVFQARPLAVAAIALLADGFERLQEIYAGAALVVPPRQTIGEQGQLAAQMVLDRSVQELEGFVLGSYGVVSAGDTAAVAYARWARLAGMAEEYVAAHGEQRGAEVLTRSVAPGQALAALRQALSEKAGTPLLLAGGLPLSPDVSPPANPFASMARRHGLAALPAGDLCAFGETAAASRWVREAYAHSVEIAATARALGGQPAARAARLFEAEMADRPSSAPAGDFTGESALISGAASGIGRACVESFLARGAAVVGLDINPGIEGLFLRPDFLGIRCDLTDEAAILRALEMTAATYGGLDMLVLNAGVFPAGRDIASLGLDEWQRVFRINLDANLVLLREAYPLLKLAPHRGRVLVNGSRNVPAPGPGAAAYSASKAALTQLARVAALEWAKDGIRVNVIHPHGVFDTGIWTQDVLETRAARYGLTVEQYKTNNLLHCEITSRDVAELAAVMCGPAFANVTGAQVPMDGGSDRVI